MPPGRGEPDFAPMALGSLHRDVTPDDREPFRPVDGGGRPVRLHPIIDVRAVRHAKEGAVVVK